jgi:hypothetical protein
VIALDRVRVRPDEEPITMPVDKARIAVVATGADAERVRRLCHDMSLFVPVMANAAIVHESLRMVVFGEPSPPAPERVVHVVRPNLADQPLRDLLRALATGRIPMPPPSRAIAAEAPVLTAVRRLESARDLGAIEALMVEAVTSLTGADRAYCLAYLEDGSLWSESLRRRGGDRRHAIAGMAGWAARTGLPVHATCAGDDARWFPGIDDPEGKAQQRIAVQPVVTDARRVRLVLVSVRRWRHADFNDGDLRWLATYAELAGPIVERILSRPITVPPPLAEAEAEEDEDDDEDDDEVEEVEELEPEDAEEDGEAEEEQDEEADEDEEDESDRVRTGLMMKVEPPEDTTVENAPTAPPQQQQPPHVVEATAGKDRERTPPSTTLPGVRRGELRSPAVNDVREAEAAMREMDAMARKVKQVKAAEAKLAAARAALAEAEAALALAKTGHFESDEEEEEPEAEE